MIGKIPAACVIESPADADVLLDACGKIVDRDLFGYTAGSMQVGRMAWRKPFPSVVDLDFVVRDEKSPPESFVEFIHDAGSAVPVMTVRRIYGRTDLQGFEFIKMGPMEPVNTQPTRVIAKD